METFCLKWNEFEVNIRESFKELRDGHNHFDVTLATDDGNQIKAHKIILSAGSTFFSEIFKNIKHQNPFIYLKGIKRVELEHIIDFLYNGEANIGQEELNNFLETAQELGVKGLLSNGKDEKERKQEIDITDVKIRSKEISGSCNASSENVVVSLVDFEDDFEHNHSDLVQAPQNNYQLDPNQDLDFQIETMLMKNGGAWQCKVCGKTTNQKRDLKRHAEMHIDGVSHLSGFCNKTFPTRNSLRMHKQRKHNINFQ